MRISVSRNLIENHKTIEWRRNFDWIPNHDLNIIIGNNGSGKSFLIKSLIDTYCDGAVYDTIIDTVAWSKEEANLINKNLESTRLEYYYEELYNNYCLIDKHRRQKIYKNDLSDGERNYLTCLCIAYAIKKRKQCLIIDDIESNMHIRLQKDLISTMFKINPKLQLICTTHSPEIVCLHKKACIQIEDTFKKEEK
jgi:predicted ATPase